MVKGFWGCWFRVGMEVGIEVGVEFGVEAVHQVETEVEVEAGVEVAHPRVERLAIGRGSAMVWGFGGSG